MKEFKKYYYVDRNKLKIKEKEIWRKKEKKWNVLLSKKLKIVKNKI